LCFTRDLQGKTWQNVFISNDIVDLCIVNHNTYIAPLYFYNGVEHKDMLPLEWEGEGMKFANFTDDFVKTYLDKLSFQPEPEEVLAYIYAVLHSPVYREKYIEFLKTDFPAVPMTTDETVFRKYAALGQRLVDLHLLNEQGIAGQARNDEEILVSGEITDNFIVEKFDCNNNILSLQTTNNDKVAVIAFSGVTKEIYNFEIGSYKPIEKWLKYRIKDKVELSASDIGHLKNMLIAIKGTLATMKEIEELGEEYLK
jgi:predicted helicase